MAPTVPELGRFAEPALLILVSLSEGPKHGYAIMTDVEAATGRPLGPGTLYAALSRLEERGFIEALEPVERRRPYRLTGLGSTVLTEQLRQLSEFAELGLRRLGDASRCWVRRVARRGIRPPRGSSRDGGSGFPRAGRASRSATSSRAVRKPGEG